MRAVCPGFTVKMTAGLMIAITALARLMKTTPQIVVKAPAAISTPIMLLLFFMVSPCASIEME